MQKKVRPDTASVFVIRDINADLMRTLKRRVTSRMQRPGGATCDCPVLTALLNCSPRSSVVTSKNSKQGVEAENRSAAGEQTPRLNHEAMAPRLVEQPVGCRTR